MNINNFQKLIESLSLTLIQPMKIEFERKSDFPVDNSEIQINWKVAYPNNSYEISENLLKLYPLFEVEMSSQDEIVYSHKSIFAVFFTIKDFDLFNSEWKQDENQRIFRERQIVKTLWPIVRQQVLDGMSRLALTPIPLPWIH